MNEFFFVRLELDSARSLLSLIWTWNKWVKSNYGWNRLHLLNALIIKRVQHGFIDYLPPIGPDLMPDRPCHQLLWSLLWIIGPSLLTSPYLPTSPKNILLASALSLISRVKAHYQELNLICPLSKIWIRIKKSTYSCLLFGL